MHAHRLYRVLHPSQVKSTYKTWEPRFLSSFSGHVIYPKGRPESGVKTHTLGRNLQLLARIEAFPPPLSPSRPPPRLNSCGCSKCNWVISLERCRFQIVYVGYSGLFSSGIHVYSWQRRCFASPPNRHLIVNKP